MIRYGFAVGVILALGCSGPVLADNCTAQRQAITNNIAQARARGEDERVASLRNRQEAVRTQCTQDELRNQRTETIRNRAQEVQQRQNERAEARRERAREERAQRLRNQQTQK